MSRDVLLNGIADPDIRREILGTKNVTQSPVNEVISLVESKEKARNALPSSSVSAVSSFRRQQNPRPDTTTMKPPPPPSPADQSKEATCPDCHQRFKIFTEGARGWNTKSHQVCITCYRTRRRNKRARLSTTESPFHLARRVPKNSWKTVTDTWNGYHSVPLRLSDRHLTTFITPFGRWRYTRAPQGFLSSGDGYNRRFDAILSSFDRKERCVDDIIHHDSDLEQHWWRTIDLLSLLGEAGVVVNPEKFQFASKCVDFAGFRISESTVEPLPKYLDAIRDFPSPTSTTDIRSWFGLVNQVANYAQLRDTMAPFKPFLSPRCKFSWTTELEDAFQTSKRAVIDAIRTGVEIFDIKRRTCLRPDWSTRGIGYFLLQRHCDCPSGIPDCCPRGWRITLAGSRFLSPAEQRYAAIEGEALAVAWGLEQTRYFTQGCDDLVVVTDHKPLTKIIGDRTLDEITNPRLFRLKQRTLPWRFNIFHLPGKLNFAADATSRHPSPSGSCSPTETQESMLVASIRSEVKQLGIISWAHIAQHTAMDASLSRLLSIIQHDHQESYQTDPELAAFWPLRESIYVTHGVLMYQDRVVIPPSLRPQVLQHLHAAHQGTSTMEQRARMIIYWPGMTQDIRATRERSWIRHLMRAECV